MKINLSITLDIDTTTWDNMYNVIDPFVFNSTSTNKKLMIEDVKQHFNNSVYEHYNSLGVLKC